MCLEPNVFQQLLFMKSMASDYYEFLMTSDEEVEEQQKALLQEAKAVTFQEKEYKFCGNDNFWKLKYVS